jgi:hypothetical protein
MASIGISGRFRSHPACKGEARDALARAVFFNRLGELRGRTYENQQRRASGLNPVVAAIAPWNTVHLEQPALPLSVQFFTKLGAHDRWGDAREDPTKLVENRPASPMSDWLKTKPEPLLLFP